MFKNKKFIKYFIWSVLFFSILWTTFYVGVIENPDFNIYDFCMGLASELVGAVIALLIIDVYIKTKTDYREERISSLQKETDASPKNNSAEALPASSGARLGNITIGCTNAAQLQAFYSKLLGWAACSHQGRPAMQSPNGPLVLFIQAEAANKKARQPKEQIRLDFYVEDLPGAITQAEALGAQLTAKPADGHTCATLADPEGNLFYLCAAS